MTDRPTTPQPRHSQAPTNSSEAEMIEERTAYAKHRWYVLLGLLTLAAVAFFCGLGTLALLGPDEPRYAEVAREMFATGDYLSPRLCGCLWFEKPALFYWLAAGSYRIFGVGEFAARVPSALAATLTALFLGRVLWRSGSTRLGVAVPLVLMSSGLFIGYARAATPDMLLAASMTAAIISGHFVAIANEDAGRLKWLLLCAAAAALSVLAKGLVGVVLLVPILGLYFAIAGNLRSVRWQACAAALAVFLIVTASWYLPVTIKHGWAFIDQFFIDHHFRRYVSNRFSHRQPFYFYPALAVYGVAPWSFFLIAAAVRIRRLRPRRDHRDSLLTLAWIWVAVPIIFYSFSASKLPGYILPVFPALAIIIAAEVERLWRGEWTRGQNGVAWLTALLLVGLGAGYALYLRREGVDESGWRVALVWLPFAVALMSVGMLAASKRRVFTLGLAVVVAAVIIGTTTLLFPKVNDQWSLRLLSRKAAAALQPDEKIGFFIYKEFAPVFYAEGRVECGYPEGDILNALHQDRLVAALEKESSLVVITLERWQDDLEDDGRFDMEFIGSQGEALAYRVKLKKR